MPASKNNSSKDIHCWFCLNEGPDEKGNPLMRDCSCRGDSGYCHLPCLINYAEIKSRSTGDLIVTGFTEPWNKCSLCKQAYRNELGVQLADAFVDFVEREYVECFRFLEAYVLKLQAIGLSNVNHEMAAEAIKTGHKILDLVQELREDEELPPLPERVLSMEANALKVVGYFTDLEGDSTTAMSYFQKYLKASKAFGYTTGVRDAELLIAREKAKGGTFDESLEKQRAHYEHAVESWGESSGQAIQSGVRLGMALHKDGRTIEGERLLSKTAKICRQVHGPDHDDTSYAEQHLKQVMMRQVALMPEKKIYEALRYEGERCVIRGPLSEPESARKTFPCNPDFLFVKPGTPVVCFGLKNAKHLNGKMGEAKSINEEGRYEVHFDDERIKPCLVKPQNLKVVFDVTNGK